ncbi:expressed unknown protein [Seminavis robusta]|uniref:Uncharacterized protein n=1 Tax=Seminavis robusta TaxID=568900 RepID=A0A9N8DHB9_9STRA|nr:expressed unknown protein [Seminavis robusta]|eukprot:Sro121_g058940.1 n/a (227) ;mRNA; r:69323-70003
MFIAATISITSNDNNALVSQSQQQQQKSPQFMESLNTKLLSEVFSWLENDNTTSFHLALTNKRCYQAWKGFRRPSPLPLRFVGTLGDWSDDEDDEDCRDGPTCQQEPFALEVGMNNYQPEGELLTTIHVVATNDDDESSEDEDYDDVSDDDDSVQQLRDNLYCGYDMRRSDVLSLVDCVKPSVVRRIHRQRNRLCRSIPWKDILEEMKVGLLALMIARTVMQEVRL